MIKIRPKSFNVYKLKSLAHMYVLLIENEETRNYPETANYDFSEVTHTASVARNNAASYYFERDCYLIK